MYHLALSLYQQYTSREEYSLLLLGLDNAGKTTLLSAIRSFYPAPHAPGTTTSRGGGGDAGRAGLPSIAQNTVPTVGQTVATIELPDMYLKIWDVGGQHSLRRLWKSYYKSCHAIIFCLDSTDLGGDLADGTEWEEIARRGSSTVGNGATAAASQEDDDDAEDKDDTPASKIARSSIHDKVKGKGKAKKEDGEDLQDSHLGRLEECRLVLENILESADTAGVPVLVLANKQDREDCVETVRIKEGLVRPIFEGEKGHAVRDSRVLPISALKGTGVKESIEWIRSRVLWNKEARPPLLR